MSAVLPLFTTVDADAMIGDLPFIERENWLSRCLCFPSSSQVGPDIDNSGVTETPYLVCCLAGSLRVMGFQAGRLVDTCLAPGEAACWMAGCWLHSSGGRRLRLNLGVDYRLLALRGSRSSDRLRGRLRPGPRPVLQDALLASLPAARGTAALQQARCLLDVATRECLAELPGGDRARASFLAIVHHLREHAHLAPDRRAVPTALGMHVGHVSRLVQRFAGCGFGALLQRFQLERARRLLLDEQREVGGIALAVGFASSTYFIRIFKAVHGCTPARWRAAHRSASSSAPNREEGTP